LDLGILGTVSLGSNFFTGLLSIILIDIVLAGDNAVVIAMAVKSLPKAQRTKGILFGAGAAVVLRVVMTFFAYKLVELPYVKLIGGVLVLWIGVKLLAEGAPDEDRRMEAKTLWQAIWIIMIADISMSLDNVLAVAGACKGDWFLLLFGLGLSIPLVLFTSSFFSTLMDRFPLVLYIGAAILGAVGGEMIATDPFISALYPSIEYLEIGSELVCTVAVVLTGKAWVAWKRSQYPVCSVERKQPEAG
jgi:YjbE family integral membrane protein